jgi:hypothetical protein
MGVYLLGPILMFIGATAHGGGFSQFQGWEVKWLLVSMFVPFVTLVLSGYQGTVFGLLATTLIMFIIRFTLERKSFAKETV